VRPRHRGVAAVAAVAAALGRRHALLPAGRAERAREVRRLQFELPLLLLLLLLLVVAAVAPLVDAGGGGGGGGALARALVVGRGGRRRVVADLIIEW